MRAFFILSILVALYYVLFKSKKFMHMLQQNWYNDGNRYFNWMIDNSKKVFLNFDLLFILFIALYFIKNAYLSIICFVILYILSDKIFENKVKKEQSKKPLVITARIKRIITGQYARVRKKGTRLEQI